jgi:hypothetical protein
MILSRQCACGQKVEFEAEDLASLTCPSCGQSLHEQFAPPPPPPRFDPSPNEQAQANRAKLDADIARILTPSATAKTLTAVRANTCYKTLRDLINAGVTISLIIVFAFAFFELYATTQRANADLLSPPILTVLAGCALTTFVLVALRQALLLGIDAVDILIAGRTDRLAAQAADPNPRAESPAPIGK